MGEVKFAGWQEKRKVSVGMQEESQPAPCLLKGEREEGAGDPRQPPLPSANESSLSSHDPNGDPRSIKRLRFGPDRERDLGEESE
jgi:hypothetical protein